MQKRLAVRATRWGTSEDEMEADNQTMCGAADRCSAASEREMSAWQQQQSDVEQRMPCVQRNARPMIWWRRVMKSIVDEMRRCDAMRCGRCV